MRKTLMFYLGLLASLGTLALAPNAHADMVALCVGCTTNAQFKGAAWQVLGQRYTQGTNVLVVNPDSGLSKWVYLERLPSGVSRNAVPKIASSEASIPMQVGTAVGLRSNPFAAIYVATYAEPQSGAARNNIDAVGIHDASASDVSNNEQFAIDTAIKLTEKTYFVQLNSSEFPSYEGSMPIEIANANYTALSKVTGLGWPPSGLLKGDLDALLKILDVYTGRSPMVCDVFGNGDSACFVPDPANRDVATQSGSARSASGQQLPDIATRVAGGGDGGLGARLDPPNIVYYLPHEESGDVVCGFVDGALSTCILQF